jgi:hypothetical protein
MEFMNGGDLSAVISTLADIRTGGEAQSVVNSSNSSASSSSGGGGGGGSGGGGGGSGGGGGGGGGDGEFAGDRDSDVTARRYSMLYTLHAIHTIHYTHTASWPAGQTGFGRCMRAAMKTATAINRSPPCRLPTLALQATSAIW